MKNSVVSGEKEDDGVRVFQAAMFECARCGTKVSAEELAKLPEPTCANCGYKIFRKVRGSTPKNLKAE